jgi:hypothetical protein
MVLQRILFQIKNRDSTGEKQKIHIRRVQGIANHIRDNVKMVLAYMWLIGVEDTVG